MRFASQLRTGVIDSGGAPDAVPTADTSASLINPLAVSIRTNDELAAEVFRTPADMDADPVAALTPRQREIVQCLAEGQSAKQIAKTLNLSARTVEDHKYRLMETLGIENSAELIHFAIKHSLVR